MNITNNGRLTAVLGKRLGLRGMLMLGGLLVLFPKSGFAVNADEHVILLHGLARTDRSMAKLARHLSKNGFVTHNVGYPSRKKSVETLARQVLPPAITACRESGARAIHFVTHSMGGILVRYYLHHYDIPELGRVVMISPPNRGSEAVDKLRDNLFFKWVNGPAGQQLGTDAASLPNRLGPIKFELGVITGDRSVNLLLSWLIPGPDDGKVAIDRARVDGMADFIVVHATHPFIMKNKRVMAQVCSFLTYGRFERQVVNDTP